MSRSVAEEMSPVAALQKVLAGEHAAVYLYGILGARASKSRQPTLFRALDDAYEAHRAARDQLTGLISRKGADPVAAEVSYGLPGAASTPRQIIDTAHTVEQRLTRLYGELVAHTSGSDRRRAISGLDASALRELQFGGRPSRFPGLGS